MWHAVMWFRRKRLGETACRLFVACFVASLVASAAAREAAAPPDADAIREHVGAVVDLVELSTGKRFVRPSLVGLVERNGRVSGLKLQPEGESKPVVVSLSGVVKVIADRETVYEAASRNTSAMGLKARKLREAYDRAERESAERMAARGVAPWPALSSEEHEAAVEELETFVARIRESFPRLQTTSTHEFLVATDIPPEQMAPFAANLDRMHDFLCDLYGIPKGEPVWRGKCLVVAFADEDDFHAFEARFMGGDVPVGVHGVCHQRDDGRVVMACHRGGDELAFAHMLVHETSHGFNHRWISPSRMPSWLNEGIAEWVGTQVVPACTQVAIKEAQAAEFVRRNGTLGPDFFSDAPDARIEPVQYGMASALVKFMVSRDRRQFAAFVRGVKEGATVEESLGRTFRSSLADLAKAYGTGLGVPGLAP
jgi:hypothetical protein